LDDLSAATRRENDPRGVSHAPASRVAIIGAGHVGATAAYALMLRALFREIVLIDSDAGLARAEAADIADADALARPASIWAGGYADAAAASIAVITAGAATHGKETRLSVAARSAVIVRQCAAGLAAAGFGGILLVAANPVDLMTLVACQASGLPPQRVIGTGTLLDSGRLKQALASRLNVAPASVDAMILGEHGDSSVAAFSTARIGGLSLAEFASDDPIDPARIAEAVKTAAYDIIAGKGYTSFGVATAIVRICEAVIRNEHAVLPVSTKLTGQFDIADVCLSLPCVLGEGGIERVLTPSLSEIEISALRFSAGVIREALSHVESDDAGRMNDN
jgi:L-lactate dehydrogenase